MAAKKKRESRSVSESSPTSTDPAGLGEPSSDDGAAERNHVFPVVGLVASAGGLEALNEFFGAINHDIGMAFVIVSHLDPERKSALPEILSKVCRLPVSEVKEGMAVEANHVYVIPPNAQMVITGGVLHL